MEAVIQTKSLDAGKQRTANKGFAVIICNLIKFKKYDKRQQAFKEL